MENPKTSEQVMALTKDIYCIRQRLQEFKSILSQKYPDEVLKDFDAETESLLSAVFGNPSEVLEAYAYAQTGEAAGWINLPEGAQEEGAQDIAQESLHQRQRVLERGLAELEAKQAKLGK